MVGFKVILNYVLLGCNWILDPAQGGPTIPLGWSCAGPNIQLGLVPTTPNVILGSAHVRTQHPYEYVPGMIQRNFGSCTKQDPTSN